MAEYEGALLIFAGADRTNINKVGDAMGRGPETFTRKFTETSPPLWNSDVDGWYAFQAGGTSAFTMWSSLVGTLPTLDDNGNPIVWSEWGLTSAEAEAALGLLTVYAYSSSEPQNAFIAATAGSFSPPLYVVPDPEI